MEALEQQSFDLGWDYAALGRPVPESANKMFCDGYRAWRSSDRRKTKCPDRYERKWLQIRFGAQKRRKPFCQSVTPQYLKRITPASERCPVIDIQFTYGENKDTDWSVDRANNDRGYVRGNIVIMSRLANAAKGDKSLDDIMHLATHDVISERLTPDQWHRLGVLVEPAFGDDDAGVSPIPILYGQPVALGMPVSPIAGFQVALTRCLIAGWDKEQRNLMSAYLRVLERMCCRTKSQRRTFNSLVQEILRRSTHVPSYAEIWSTIRVQRRLLAFVNALGGRGLSRLSDVQKFTVGEQNTKIV